MSEFLDHIVRIDPAWSGPTFLAGRPIALNSNGYDAILDRFSGEIVRSTTGGSRSSARVQIHNCPWNGQLVSDYVRADRIENREVSIIELIDVATERVLYQGVVRSRTLSELFVLLDLVEPSLSRSKLIGRPVDSDVWPRAKQADVGSPIPVPFGSVEDAILPQVEFNPFSRLSEAMTASTTTITVGDVERFPTSGRLRIREELIDYSGIDTVSNTFLGVNRGAGGTAAAPHTIGETVISVDELSLGVDDAGGASVVTRAFAIGNDDEKFVIPTPVMDLRNGVRVAVFEETPLYEQPLGGLDVVKVPLNNNLGSNPAINPQNAIELAQGFTLSRFASIDGSSGPLRGIRSQAAIPRGDVEKILVEVLHSGDKAQSPVGQSDFDSVVGDVEVSIGGVAVGALTNEELVDALFIEAGGDTEVFREPPENQILGPQVVVGERTEFSQAVLNTIAGFPTTRLENAGDEALQIDGDDLTVSLIGNGYTGPSFNEINYLLPQLPTSVPETAVINRIRFIWSHGFGGEATFTSLGRIEIRDNLTLISTQLDFPNSGPGPTNRVLDSNTDAALNAWLAAGRTARDLQNLRCIFINRQNGLNDPDWGLAGAYLELDYTYVVEPDRGNPVTNQFDVTSILPDWENLAGSDITLTPAVAGTTDLRVYRLAFQVVYAPTELRPADRIAVDIDSAISGTPAEVIETFWTDPALGGNAGRINAAEFAAASASLLALGFDSSSVAGLVRNQELFVFLLELSAQSRLRTFVDPKTLLLRTQFLDDLANLPAAGSTVITKDDLTAIPEIEGSDIDRDIVNRLTFSFDVTDLERERQNGSLQNTASIALYGEKLEEVVYSYLKTLATAQSVAGLRLERESAPFESISLTLVLDFRDLDLFDLLNLQLDWVAIPRFEVETITENFQSATITVKGRAL